MANKLQPAEAIEEEPSSSPFTIADYVQLSCMGRRSVALKLVDRGHVIAKVFVVEGEIWHAEDRRGTGPDAFKRWAMSQNEVRVEPLLRPPGTRTVTSGWERLLLDAAILKDTDTRPSDAPSAAANENKYAPSTAPPQSLKEATRVISQGISAKPEIPPALEPAATQRSIAIHAAPQSTDTKEKISLPPPRKSLAPSLARIKVRSQASPAPSLSNNIFSESESTVSVNSPFVDAPSTSRSFTQVKDLSPPKSPSLLSLPPLGEKKKSSIRPVVLMALLTICVGILFFVYPVLELKFLQGAVSSSSFLASPAKSSVAEHGLPTVEDPRSSSLSLPTSDPIEVTDSTNAKETPSLPPLDPPERSASAALPPLDQSSPDLGKQRPPNAEPPLLEPKELTPELSEADSPEVEALNPLAKSITPIPPQPAPQTRQETIQATPTARKQAVPSDHPVPLTPQPLVQRATTRLVGFTMSGPPSAAKLSSSVARAKKSFANCYARAAQSAGHNAFGRLTVNLSLNARGEPSPPQVSGTVLPGLNGCVASVAQRIRTRPHAGAERIRASWTIVYTP